jgi:hypothetical protein
VKRLPGQKATVPAALPNAASTAQIVQYHEQTQAST